MTQDLTKIIEVEPSFDDKARTCLSSEDYTQLVNYIKNAGPEISVATANRFFELYLHGNDVNEIINLNPSFKKESITWAMVKYGWNKAKEEYMHKIQAGIMQKVMKAQLEAASLYSDMISATMKKNGHKLKKYLQSGNEKDLAGVLLPDTILQLSKVIEGLQKVTGQDKNIRITKDENVNVSFNATVDVTGSSLSPVAAAEVLRIVAEEKRKKERSTPTIDGAKNEKADKT